MWETMLDRWIGKKVNLKLLSESLTQFFGEEGFSSKVELESVNEYRIAAVPKRPTNIQGSVNVFIRGSSEGFEVEFASTARSRFSRAATGLQTLLGLGPLLLRDLKSEEELRALETRFWSFVDRKIDGLSMV